MEAWHFEPAHDLGLNAAQRRLSLLPRGRTGKRDFVFSLAIDHACLPCHRTSLKNSWPGQFAGACSVYSGGESCQSSRCHYPRRNFASAICRRRVSDCRWRHIFYQTGVLDFRDRIYERAPNLAKKLRRAFTGRFAGAIDARRVHLHFVSGRNTLSHGRDGEVQTRAWATRRGNGHPDRALLSERNIFGFAGIGNRAALEKNFAWHVGKPLSFAETTNDRTGWGSIAAATEDAVRNLMT